MSLVCPPPSTRRNMTDCSTANEPGIYGSRSSSGGIVDSGGAEQGSVLELRGEDLSYVLRALTRKSSVSGPRGP